jgi:LysM repeat protein
MTLKRILILLGLAVLVLSLAACELSASTPPPTTLTSEGPMSTLQSQLEAIATQTAAAGGGVALPTLAPLPPTSTPEAQEGGGQQQPTQAAQPTQAPTKKPKTPKPTNPPVVVATSTPGIPKNYTLHDGETPYCIARRFDVDQNELLSLNGLSINTIVSVGTTLKIPQTGNPFISERALREHPATYTVQEGESVYEIACKFGDVSPESIIAANNIENPDKDLKAGRKIDIP